MENANRDNKLGSDLKTYKGGNTLILKVSLFSNPTLLNYFKVIESVPLNEQMGRVPLAIHVKLSSTEHKSVHPSYIIPKGKSHG